MSRATLHDVKTFRGKMSKKSEGYYYVTKKNRQYYRLREETYQKNQSPRQKWNSLAFGYAHKRVRQIWTNQEQIDQVTLEWTEAKRIGPNNRTYSEPKEWKFVMLQQQWKQDNPFDAWYEAYIQDFAAKIAQKTSSETVSTRTLLRQADLLEAQAKALREQAQQNV